MKLSTVEKNLYLLSGLSDDNLHIELNQQTNTPDWVQFEAGSLGNLRLTVKRAVLTTTAAATAVSTDFFPANSLVLALNARVKTILAGPTSWLLGNETDDNAFGDTLALAAGTLTNWADWTAVKPLLVAAEENLVITRGSATDFTAGGVVAVTAWILSTTAPSE